MCPLVDVAGHFVEGYSVFLPRATSQTLKTLSFPSGRQKGPLERTPRRKERRHGHTEMVIIPTVTA